MVISDYKPGDETAILNLFKMSFGKDMSETYWRWRFIEHPEKKIMIKLMWDGETLAGHYAVSPARLHFKGESILTALSMTTMTHPSYAGRGIFTQLAEYLYQDEAKKNNLKAVWGFPNNNSHYGFIKNLGWKDLIQIPCFSINADAVKPYTEQAITKISGFTDSHANVQHINKSRLYCIKSADFLTWRYTKNPVNSYDIFELRIKEISYYAVTKPFCSDRTNKIYDIDIVELIFPEDFQSILSLINAIKNNYREFSLGKINLWFPVNNQFHILLEKIGFYNTSPITYFGVRVLDVNYQYMERPEKWAYSMGDSDIY